MLHAWTVSEVTLHTGKNLFLQKMQLLQFCVHWTCPWLQLCHVKVLHEPHENFWNTNICNFGCFIPTQCQSYLIWQNHKFFAIYSCPAQPDFQNLSAVYFSFNCTDKIESFSQNFQQHFFHDTYFVKILQTREYISTRTNHLLSMTQSSTKCLSHVSALMNMSIVWADSIKEIWIIFSSNWRHD